MSEAATQKAVKLLSWRDWEYAGWAEQDRGTEEPLSVGAKCEHGMYSPLYCSGCRDTKGTGFLNNPHRKLPDCPLPVQSWPKSETLYHELFDFVDFEPSIWQMEKNVLVVVAGTDSAPFHYQLRREVWRPPSLSYRIHRPKVQLTNPQQPFLRWWASPFHLRRDLARYIRQRLWDSRPPVGVAEVLNGATLRGLRFAEKWRTSRGLREWKLKVADGMLLWGCSDRTARRKLVEMDELPALHQCLLAFRKLARRLRFPIVLPIHNFYPKGQS